MPPLEQRAALYQGENKMLAYPTNRVCAGFYLASTPYLTVEEKLPRSVGAAVRAALAAFKVDVPTPVRGDYKGIAKARHEAAGVRSEATFMRGARCVDVVWEDGFVLTPHRNGGASGPKRGFYAILAKKVSLPHAADDLSLGTACLQTLELCE
jgi:hypothetical protein